MVMKNFDFNAALAKAQAATLPKVVAASGTYSFGIVNNKNGKRLTFSKALANRLALDDHVEMLVSKEDNVLFVAKELPGDNTLEGDLRGDDKKICYSGPLAKLLSDVFGLNFSTKTSMAFYDMDFQMVGNHEVAAIHITDQDAESGAAS